MLRCRAWFVLLVLAASLGGCAVPHQDTVMQSGPDGVIISYYGDVNDTLRLARQHCAQFERVPVFRGTKENSAFYSCVR